MKRNKYNGVRDICNFFIMKCRGKTNNSFQYYRNGSHKLEKLLDIGNLIKTVSKTK